jgi:hypothetical protein
MIEDKIRSHPFILKNLRQTQSYDTSLAVPSGYN